MKGVIPVVGLSGMMNQSDLWCELRDLFHQFPQFFIYPSFPKLVISVSSCAHLSCTQMYRLHIIAYIWHSYPQVKLTQVETKWLTFCRQHFQVHFCELKLFIFRLNLIEICSLGTNWQLVSFGSGNSLAQNRWQAITLTNDDLVQWCIVYVSLGLSVLTH